MPARPPKRAAIPEKYGAPLTMCGQVIMTPTISGTIAPSEKTNSAVREKRHALRQLIALSGSDRYSAPTAAPPLVEAVTAKTTPVMAIAPRDTITIVGWRISASGREPIVHLAGWGST